MSRCFPFPPPGYDKIDEPLVEPIKKEKEKAKKDKKEKKEKRKEKKVKNTDVDGQHADNKPKHKKRHRNEKPQSEKKLAEQLERSDLSEEQGSPSIPYVCESPDSAQNNNKRRKQNASEAIDNIHGAGVRIKLSAKPKEPEPIAPVENPIAQSLQQPKQKQIALAVTSVQPSVRLSKQKVIAPRTPAQRSFPLPNQKEIPSAKSVKQSSLPLPKQSKLAPPTTSPSCLMLPKQNRIAQARQTSESSLTLAKQRQVAVSSPLEHPSITLPKQDAIAKPSWTAQPCLPLPKHKQVAVSASLEQPCSSLPRQHEIAHRRQAGQPCLPLPKHKQVAVSTSLEQPCSTLPKQHEIAQPSWTAQPCLPLPKHKEAAVSAPVEQPCFSGRMETTSVHEPNFLPAYTGSSKSRRKEAKFRDLIVNWEPQPLEIEKYDEGDVEWLTCSSRPRCDDKMKSCSSESMLLDQGALVPSWPPKACHLVEADVYARPFALPF